MSSSRWFEIYSFCEDEDRLWSFRTDNGRAHSVAMAIMAKVREEGDEVNNLEELDPSRLQGVLNWFKTKNESDHKPQEFLFPLGSVTTHSSFTDKDLKKLQKKQILNKHLSNVDNDIQILEENVKFMMEKLEKLKNVKKAYKSALDELEKSK